MSDFQFPRLHITKIFEEDGDLYEEAVTAPICDFCYDTRVVWDYETDKFYLEEIGFGSDEGWTVCEVCAKFIEARQLPPLTLRILKSWQALGIPFAGDEIDKAGQIVQGFFDHLHPGRKAFG